MKSFIKSMMLSSMILGGSLCTTVQADTPNELLDLQHQWAQVKYKTPPGKPQEEAIATLADKAQQMSAMHKDEAPYLVWQAIILSTQAGIEGGLGALSKVKEARSLLEKAEGIDPNALDGSVMTSLGSLYYQVPGWPIGFGSDKKARKYLEKAVQMNPTGIDPNYFYGDFLVEQRDYKAAEKVLTQALNAPDRPDRPIADEGRRGEIRELLAKIARKKKR